MTAGQGETVTTQLFEAVRNNDAQQVGRLVEERPELATACDENGVSAVLTALYQGRGEIVETLLANDPELDIFEAAAIGAAERVQALLEEDPARVSAWSPDGFMPLHLASFFGRGDVVRTLLEHGANVRAVARHTSIRVAPLHSAAAGGGLEIVERLLDHGADPNARQEGGFTALHSAAQNGDTETAELLLSRGADRRIQTEDGRTPADLARDSGHPELARRLEN